MTRVMTGWLCAMLATCALAARAADLPEGNAGLATKYPGDLGIEKDPNVVFVEKFDEPSLDVLTRRYSDVLNRGIMSQVADVAPGSADPKSLLLTHVGGQGDGGHLYRTLAPGYEQLFARWYVKFDPNCASISHLDTGMGGYNPLTEYPRGNAGNRPSGSDRFTTELDTYGSVWNWGFYTYWKDMHSTGGGRYYGNTFTNGVPGLGVDKGRWICVELMVKMNSPISESNGEQAFWIDGKLVRDKGQVVSYNGKDFPRGYWTPDQFRPDPAREPLGGFQWRTVEELKINFVVTELYIAAAPAGRVSRVWFDNMAVAKSYIGPIASGRSGPASGTGKVAPPPGWGQEGQ